MKLALKEILKNSKTDYSPVVKFKTDHPALVVLDLSENNLELQKLDIKDTETFNRWISRQLVYKEAEAGIGGYGENRIIYRRSDHYDGDEPRSIHLGLDIWMPAGTEIFAPLEGIIHSFQDNQGFGNYGPTLILEHQLQQIRFFSLYGHLCREDLKNYQRGQKVASGTRIGTIGPYPENGDWPPHLHFQVITDLLGNNGDFPGVAKPSQKDFYLTNCPDPNLILNLNLNE